MKSKLVFMLLLVSSASLAQAPGGSRAVTSYNFNNLLYVDGVKYKTPQACIAAVINPGTCTIPSGVARGSVWITPANYVGILDTRFTNDLGFQEGALPNQHSHWYFDFHAGTNDSYESNNLSGPIGISINGFADAGGFLGNNFKANAVSFQAGMARALSSNRPVWSADFNTSYLANGTTNNARGIEVDLSNTGGIDDSSGIGIALNVISGGSKKAGVGLQINSINPATEFVNGEILNNYSNIGLLISNQDVARIADIYIVPPANDASSEILGRNAANSSTIWSIDDSGKISTKGLVTGLFWSTSTANPAISGHIRLASTDTITWRNNTNSGDVSLSKSTSDALVWPKAMNAGAYSTFTNCSNSTREAACGTAAAGSFVIDVATTTTIVSTTAVTANSQIFLQEDSSLGTRLGVTCNTQSSRTLGALRVAARTVATSFTATLEVGPSTNPMCVSYFIVN